MTLEPHNPFIPGPFVFPLTAERRSTSVDQDRSPTSVDVVDRSCHCLAKFKSQDTQNLQLRHTWVPTSTCTMTAAGFPVTCA